MHKPAHSTQSRGQESVGTLRESPVDRPRNNSPQGLNQKETLEDSNMETESISEQHPAAANKSLQKTAPKQEYAAIPVGEWLLFIEKLVAQKDYAEAARQLQKFKQAHPKVNVEDLDAKIP